MMAGFNLPIVLHGSNLMGAFLRGTNLTTCVVFAHVLIRVILK